MRQYSFFQAHLYLILAAFFAVELFNPLPAFSVTPDEGSKQKPNVIFLMLDTTRADHLSVYGYQRPTSPALDAFSKDSVTFDFALTSAPWTPMAVASMFTGLYGSTHGMIPVNSRELAKKNAILLDESLDTLAERLKRVGYHTRGVTPNPWTTKTFNFDQGFDDLRFHQRARADALTDAALRQVDHARKDPSKPFFLFAHYLDAHDPYDPPKPYSEMFTGTPPGETFPYEPKMLNLLNRYDGEIRFMDDHLKRLFESLKAKGLYDNSLIVVVSDHGEQFREHGRYRHGFQLYNEEVHVPLMIHYPKGTGAGTRIAESVSIVDILPTILDVVGVNDNRGSLEGISLLKTAELANRKSVFMEIRRHLDMKGIATPKGEKILFEAVLKPEVETRGELFSQWYPRSKFVGIFDRRVNADEVEPIKNVALEGELKGLFEKEGTKIDEHVAAEMKGRVGDKLRDDTVEELRDLGYMEEDE